MDKERNLGVTEARFALTIVTCLVFAIGYIACCGSEEREIRPWTSAPAKFRRQAWSAR